MTRQRWLLLGLVTSAQLLCLFLGSIWLARWLETGMAELVRERLLAQSTQLAIQTVRMLEELGVESLEPGGEGWQRAQGVIRNLRVPNEAFVCIISAESGEILCHPDLETEPSLRELRLGEIEVRLGGRSGKLKDVGRSGSELAGGAAALPGGVQLIAARRAPDLGAVVLVHQHEYALGLAISAFVKGARAVFWCVAVVVTTVTVCVTAMIVGRYDRELARINQGLEQLVEHRSAQVVRSRDALIFGLAALAESRDGETGAHLERITRYTRELAEELAERGGGVDKRMVPTLEIASALHDIGKVAIPDAVLLKPEKLTDEERRIIERHPLIGGDTVMALKRRWGEDELLTAAAEIIFAHHERWDGNGYPFGQEGQAIPLAARIVAVADVYDALRSRRRYKQERSHEEVVAIIKEGAGGQFDPAVVEAFLARSEAFARISEQHPS